MSMAIVAIGSVVVGAGASIYAANKSSQAAKKANEANAKNVADTNAANYQMFQESRGSTGHAILPTYFGDTESKIGSTVGNSVQSMLTSQSTPEKLAAIQAAIDKYSGVTSQGDQLVGDIYSGALEGRRLGNYQAVADARTAAAKSVSDAFDQSINETLNRIKASEAAKGFTGGGSYANNLALGATYGARRQGAQALTQAQLENAIGRNAIQENGVTLGLGNLDFGYNRSRQTAELSGLPTRTVAANTQAALAPLGAFNIQPNAFRNDQLPQVQPVSSTGQNVGMAVAGAAGSLGNYFAQQNLANQMYGSGDYLDSYGNNTMAPGYVPPDDTSGVLPPIEGG